MYDADKVVHEIYKRPEAIAQIRTLFGETVLSPAGTVDRKALGKVVFADVAKLELLTTQVIFPRTDISIKEAIANARSSNAPALVLDAPTLFESGRDRLCDRIVFVTAPIARRQEWARKRGWESGDLERRESRMASEEVKRRRADIVIDNAGSLEETGRIAGEVFENWVLAR